jgi:glycosyltransferase involved in cell wall biosynthesis
MYNNEPYISATLASILQERDVQIEVVLVNDCSKDSSLERVREIDDERIKIINNSSNRGYAATINIGFAAARGDIIMRCDGDDLYPPHRIARQVDWLAKHPEFGAVCGSYSTIDPKGRQIANLKCGDIAEEITEELRNGITRNHFCTYAVRVEVLRALGGCRPSLNNAAEIDLQLRMGESYRVWYSPHIDYHYRLHDTSITHTQGTDERTFFDNLAIELQRQRLTQGSDDLQRGLPLLIPPQGSSKAMSSSEQAQGLLIGSAWNEHRTGNKRQAITMGIRAAMARPNNMKAWRNLVLLAVKPSGREKDR